MRLDRTSPALLARVLAFATPPGEARAVETDADEGRPIMHLGPPTPAPRARSPNAPGRIVLLFVAVSALALACASPRTRDPDLRRRASEIRILTTEEIGDREYEIVAEVEGTSCAPNPETDPSLEGARTDMRIEAAERGADAVVQAICEEVGLSIVPGCSRRIECRGDAIRWR